MRVVNLSVEVCRLTDRRDQKDAEKSFPKKRGMVGGKGSVGGRGGMGEEDGSWSLEEDHEVKDVVSRRKKLCDRGLKARQTSWGIRAETGDGIYLVVRTFATEPRSAIDVQANEECSCSLF